MIHNSYRLYARGESGAENLAMRLGISPILAQVLLNRGISSPEEARLFLYGGFADIPSPWQMMGMAEAVDLVHWALKGKHRILIYGDYDTDGVTSTAMLLSALRGLGAKAGYYIPHRVEEGYGVSMERVESAYAEGYSLLITVDCGISNKEEIQRAVDSGLKTIIIDHHEVPRELPPAHAILNPKQPACPYPFKDLCGAGVAFKLLQALGESLKVDLAGEYLDLVALGTVGDVAPLLGENRILAKEGMRVLSERRRPGLLALCRISGLEERPIGSCEVGFMLSPRLNAAGRLERADLAVDLILCKDEDLGANLARRLDELNTQRQKMESEIRQNIWKQLNESPYLVEGKALVLASPDWHVGVIGISAARMVEEMRKPVLLISTRDGKGRGSGRSVPGINLFAALDACRDLLIRFGGHEMAAGISLEEDKIPLLREKLDSCLPQIEVSRQLLPVVDMELPLSEVTLERSRELRALEPYGEGNPPPLFLLRGVRIMHPELVGNNEAHLKFKARKGSREVKAIAFRLGGENANLHVEELLYDLLANLEQDEFEGTLREFLKVQKVLRNPASEAVLSSPEVAFASVELPRVIDARNMISRKVYLRQVALRSPDVLVLVRTSFQAGQARSALQDIGVELAERVKLEYFHSLGEIPPVADIVLLSPPPTLDFLRGVDAASRIHLLFAEEEVKAEEELQEIMNPAREKLAKIYVLLKQKFAGRRLGEKELQEVETMLANPRIKKGTVKLALKVFEELDLVRFTPNGTLLILRQATKSSLEDSPTYSRIVRRMESFRELQRLLAVEPWMLEEELGRLPGTRAENSF